jgi:beta-phosphoglucomutase-like phosphatase (HAD superfamily)
MDRKHVPITSGSPNALLLDFDGTMADTVQPLAEIYAAFVARLGAGGAAPSFQEANGRDLAGLIVELSGRFMPERNPQLVWQDYWEEVRGAILAAPPCAGLLPLIEWAIAGRWKIGIATSGRSDLIAEWLRRHRLEHFIHDIVGADLVARAKPHPDIYLTLLCRLGAAVGDSIAIEDSSNGARAARAAGLPVILLGPAAAEWHDDKNCYIAADLAAAAALIRRLHGRTGD